MFTLPPTENPPNKGAGDRASRDLDVSCLEVNLDIDLPL